MATDTAYGLAKVTNSMDVTEESGIAMSAMQNNASVEGTLANSIKALELSIFDKNKMYSQNVGITISTESQKIILDFRKDTYMLMILDFTIGASSATQHIIFPKTIYGSNWNFVSVGAQSTVYLNFSYSKINELSIKTNAPADTTIVLSRICYILL